MLRGIHNRNIAESKPAIGSHLGQSKGGHERDYVTKSKIVGAIDRSTLVGRGYGSAFSDTRLCHGVTRLTGRRSLPTRGRLPGGCLAGCVSPNSSVLEDLWPATTSGLACAQTPRRWNPISSGCASGPHLNPFQLQRRYLCVHAWLPCTFILQLHVQVSRGEPGTS